MKRRVPRMLVMRAGKFGEIGQMTIELAVALPVIIVIAVIAVNVLTFFGECAEFDRIGRNAVRICASSPAYGQDLNQSAALVKATVGDRMGLPNEDVEVEASQNGWGHVSFDLTLRYRPTLFGMGLRDEIWGVSLPPLTHAVGIVVDTYKPGVLL